MRRKLVFAYVKAYIFKLMRDLALFFAALSDQILMCLGGERQIVKDSQKVQIIRCDSCKHPLAGHYRAIMN